MAADANLEKEAYERKIARDTFDLTVGSAIEFVGSVYFVGGLPLLMHFIVTLFIKPNDYRWVPAETWLIVMIISAAAATDAWRERKADPGAVITGTAFLGVIGSFFGAFAYCLLSISPRAAAQVTQGLSFWASWSAVILGVVYFLYRLPTLRREAEVDARKRRRAPRKPREKRT